MILLEPGNRVLAETVSGAIKPPVVADVDDEEKSKSSGPPQRDPIDVRLCDFDDVSYHVTIDAGNRSLLRVSISVPCYRDIEKKGAADAVKNVYKELVTKPEEGYDVTLEINMDKLPAKEEELVRKVELLKTNIIGGVFDSYFSALLNGKALTESFKFSLRGDTMVYFIPRPDKVIVVYDIDLHDESDIAIIRLMMQEFVDCRKRLGAAPPCTFSNQPPLEMKEFGITEPKPENRVGYITLAVFKSHLENNRKERIINRMQLFRNYIMYHIKCSKAYFHSRMRARVRESLKLLNRAKVEVDESKREKKTAQGKTFIRQS